MDVRQVVARSRVAVDVPAEFSPAVFARTELEPGNHVPGANRRRRPRWRAVGLLPARARQLTR